MNKKLLYIVTLICVTILGCGSSSSSLRFNKEGGKNTEGKNVRFTSGNDNTFIADNITAPDTSSVYTDDEDTDEMPEEQSIDLSEVMKRVSSSTSKHNPSADLSTMKEKMLMEIIKYLNTPYRYGGNSKDGIDCSAFTQTIYNNLFSVMLLRSAREQYTQGIEVDDRENLEFGDLVFFNTRRRVRPGHVGIYIGDNLFAHASSRNGVIVSSLDMDYYSKRFMGGRRMDSIIQVKL